MYVCDTVIEVVIMISEVTENVCYIVCRPFLYQFHLIITILGSGFCTHSFHRMKILKTWTTLNDLLCCVVFCWVALCCVVLCCAVLCCVARICAVCCDFICPLFVFRCFLHFIVISHWVLYFLVYISKWFKYWIKMFRCVCYFCFI